MEIDEMLGKNQGKELIEPPNANSSFYSVVIVDLTTLDSPWLLLQQFPFLA